MRDHDVLINTPTIDLDQFLKWAGIAATGGEAKQLILQGDIKVNGKQERRRSRTLVHGDDVIFSDEIWHIRST
jgi:ribosome-associated protein